VQCGSHFSTTNILPACLGASTSFFVAVSRLPIFSERKIYEGSEICSCSSERAGKHTCRVAGYSNSAFFTERYYNTFSGFSCSLSTQIRQPHTPLQHVTHTTWAQRREKLKMRFHKLADKLAYKVASQSNVAYMCHVCQSKVCSKQNRLAANSLRRLCMSACQKVGRKNVIVETNLNKQRKLANVCSRSRGPPE
jgi:hypothetical protein